MKRVVFVGLVFLLGACAFELAEPKATTTETQAGADSGTDDAKTSALPDGDDDDAETQVPHEAGPDGATTGTGFCGAQAADYCKDFGGGEVLDKRMTGSGNVGVSDGQLLASIPYDNNLSGDTNTAFVSTKTFASALATGVHIEATVWIAASPQNSVNAFTLFSVDIGQAGYDVNVDSAEAISVVERPSSGENKVHGSIANIPIAKKTRLVVDIVWAGTRKVTLTKDGSTKLDEALEANSPGNAGISLEYGIVGAPKPSGPWNLEIDDVAFSLK